MSALPNPLSNTTHCDAHARQRQIDNFNSVTSGFPALPSRMKAETAECALNGEISPAKDKAIDFFQNKPARADFGPLRPKRREAGGDQIGINEFNYPGVFGRNS